MISIQKKVSGHRCRFIDDKYDLDITYITQRILGMSFPASKGTQKIYRNSINKVAKFLDERHPNSYLVINLSNKDIDESKFHDSVNSYPWEDHHSPSLLVLFECCDAIFEYMNKDLKNVCIVHCNAGKGRTGTAIACSLLYSGLATNFIDALTYYGQMRFKTGRGTTQPA